MEDFATSSIVNKDTFNKTLECSITLGQDVTQYVYRYAEATFDYSLNTVNVQKYELPSFLNDKSDVKGAFEYNKQNIPKRCY